MSAYYNEIDGFAAQWLRNLIAAGHIARGDVDERSIEDVHPSDLRGYTQCHFFAGIGVWSHALRGAGWPDDRPVWTGSCPCQPFSAAGEGAGFADERHLWPDFLHLIKERRPATIFGEQVASKDAEPWIDLVSADLEGLDYQVGAVAFPAAGIGAPHIRDRLYWVAHASGTRPQGRQSARQRLDAQRPTIERSGTAGRLANLHSDGRGKAGQCLAEARCDGSFGNSTACGLGPPDSERAGRNWRAVPGALHGFDREHRSDDAGASGSSLSARPGPTNGLWRDADWMLCRDGRWRPVEPGTFPLAHGAPARVGRLRAYGNAIVAPQAQAFIQAVMECIP